MRGVKVGTIYDPEILKIRLDVKALLSDAFRYFLLHFFRAGKRS